MTRVPEKSAMGLPSKQRYGFKVHSLSKEQGSGKEMGARSRAHDSEWADFAQKPLWYLVWWRIQPPEGGCSPCNVTLGLQSTSPQPSKLCSKSLR